MPEADRLQQIDSALRLINREIWVVTAANHDQRGGLVATWVSAASIDAERPVLLAGIAPNHFTAELVQGSKAFAAHLLRTEQVELAWNFANGSGRSRDKLAGLATRGGETGAPVLVECLASFECRVFASYDAGDRLFFWADVIDGKRDHIDSDMMGEPLREHGFLSALTDEQRAELAADRLADARHNRSLHESWRATNPW